MKREIKILLFWYIIFIAILMAVCFSACSIKISNPIVIEKDFPLNPDSTIIVIPYDSIHKSSAGFFLRNDLLAAYKLPKTVSWKTFGVLRPQYINSSLYPDTTGRTVIAIGNTTLSNDNDIKGLPPASFIIKKKGRVVVIRGVDDAGDFAGIEYFLSNYCDVTHYMPVALFTKIPDYSIISLPIEINVVDSPFTRNITSTGFWGTGDPVDKSNIQYWDNYWALYNSLNYTDWGGFQHSMSSLFYDSLIMKKYPSVYKSFPSSATDPNFEPDFSSPDLVSASYDIATKYFNANPNINTLAFSVMDSRNGFTLSGQKLIDANANWLNNLSEKIPNKTIAYLLYSAVDGYPSFKLNDNVLPITVWHLSDFVADGLDRIDSLTKFTTRVGNDDWAEGKGFIFPRIYTRILSNYLKSLQKKNIKFDYAHIEAYPNWGLDGIKYWEMGQLYRNPDLDVDSLRLKFCTDLFGNASLQMKAYFDTMEDIGLWLNNTGIGTHLYNYPQQLKLDSSRLVLVGNCRKYLDAATNLAVTKEQKERVQFFNTGFTFIEKLWKMYNLKNGDKNEIIKYITDSISNNDRILFSGQSDGVINFINNMK